MTWFLNANKYKHALAELPKQRDRGAAIIATAILEDHLVAAIKSRMRADDNLEKKVFRGYGPLASFSARIDIGCLLGLYSEKVRKALHTIREIRNEFAHNMQPMSFRAQRAQCARLVAPRGAARHMNRVFAELFLKQSPGDRVQLTTFSRSTNPRIQFIRAVQQMTLLLFCINYLANEPNWTKTKGEAPEPSLPDK